MRKLRRKEAKWLRREKISKKEKLKIKKEKTHHVKLIDFIYLFGVLSRFQHCTRHITTDSWKGRGNQYIQLVKVLYCKLPTNSNKLLAFPLEVGPGTAP